MTAKRPLLSVFLVLPLLAFAGLCAPTHAQPAAAACAPHDGIEYLCGARNAEDIEQIPGRPVLVATSYGSIGPNDPRLQLIDTDHRLVSALPITVASKPDPLYGDCPAPLDPVKFAPHGLALRVGKDGQHQLYVVNHGGRESIEIFALDARAPQIKARWIGCVVLPEGTSGNAVAPMGDGGFVATKFFDTREGSEYSQFLARKKTSVVYRWSPGKGISIVPGGEMVGDNGMLVSPDVQCLNVTSWIV